MSSKQTRLSSAEKQVHFQSDGVKQGLTQNDPIERLVDELLDNNRGKHMSAETDKAHSGSQKVSGDVDQTSCEHCRSYFPLLKSFILHTESCHKGTIRDGQVESYKCDLCESSEFDSAVALGMHSLMHVAGKAPSKDSHMLSAASINDRGIQQSETTIKIKPTQLSSESKHIATRLYTRLLQQSFKDSADKGCEDSSSIETRDNVGLVVSEASDSSSTVTALSQRKRRGRSSKSQNLNIATSVAETSSIGSNSEVQHTAQGDGKTTLIKLSNLIPSLQGKGIGIDKKASDVLVIDSIIRPRECTSSSFDDGQGTTSNAYEKEITISQVAGESAMKVDAFEIQEGRIVEKASPSQFVIDEGDARKIDDYAIVDAASNAASPKITADNRRRNGPNQCIVCLEKFSSRELLKQHRMKSHGDREKWACSECNRDFSSHWKYRDHCTKVHNNKKPFKCGICGKCLSSFTILATHEGLHSGSRPHACHVCGKSYLVAAGLKEHLISHKNEREHRCQSCDARFNAKGDLKKHMVTHMAEKPHRCIVCNTGFNRSASLLRHMRTHTGEKPFKCDLCEKAFSRKEKMQEHRRTHTGERPLACPECGKTFKDSSNLSNHKKIHQPGYIPRKRKRNGVKGHSINSVVIPAGQPVVPTEEVVTGNDISSLAAVEKPDTSNRKENALKDLATITTTIEDLQSASQEWLRQFVGTAIDQNDIRNLINFQAAISLQGNALNLSAEDVRSLQLIINGVQSRTATGTDESSPQVPQ